MREQGRGEKPLSAELVQGLAGGEAAEHRSSVVRTQFPHLQPPRRLSEQGREGETARCVFKDHQTESREVCSRPQLQHRRPLTSHDSFHISLIYRRAQDVPSGVGGAAGLLAASAGWSIPPTVGRVDLPLRVQMGGRGEDGACLCPGKCQLTGKAGRWRNSGHLKVLIIIFLSCGHRAHQNDKPRSSQVLCFNFLPPPSFYTKCCHPGVGDGALTASRTPGH